MRGRTSSSRLTIRQVEDHIPASALLLCVFSRAKRPVSGASVQMSRRVLRSCLTLGTASSLPARIGASVYIYLARKKNTEQILAIVLEKCDSNDF